MKFETLASSYIKSQNFVRLTEKSKGVYKSGIKLLTQLSAEYEAKTGELFKFSQDEMGNFNGKPWGTALAISMNSEVAWQKDSPKPNSVAQSRSPVAQSRSHIDFWGKALLGSPVSNFQKNQMLALLKLIYRSHGLGYMLEGLRGFVHQRKDANPLTPESIKQLVTVAETDEEKLYANRVAFGFWTGMRPSEVRDLKWTEVGPTYITVLGAKKREAGKASRMVKIIPEVQECLNYARSLSQIAWVFVSPSGKPLNKDIECAKVKALFQKGNIKGTLYDARRGLATQMHKHGYNLTDIAGQLGHTSIVTTQLYIRNTMAEKADVFNGFGPVAPQQEK